MGREVIDMEPAEEVCTTPEAARLLGISASTVQQLVEAGIIKAWKTKGGHRRIPLTAVLAYKAGMGGAAEPLPPAAAGRARELLRVLVVEDDEMQRLVYEQHFTSWGLPMDVHYCDNGYKALLDIAATQPDVLLSDIMMSGLDGLEMIRTILQRQELADMNIAIVSSLEESELARRGGVPADVLFFSKPVDFSELRGYLRCCCAQQARLRRLEPVRTHGA